MSSYIDNHKCEYIKTLGEAVAIKSVSCWEETRPETIQVVKWFGDKLKKLGATIEIRELGNQVRQKRVFKVHTPFVIRGYIMYMHISWRVQIKSAHNLFSPDV